GTLIGPRDRGNPWFRAQFQNRLRYRSEEWFVPDDGEAVRVAGVRATDHFGRSGFAEPMPLESKPKPGASRPLPPGLLYRFRPDSGEPPVAFWDFALRLQLQAGERQARQRAVRVARRRGRKARKEP